MLQQRRRRRGRSLRRVRSGGIGSWAALHSVSDQDSDGNAVSGDVVTHDCKDSYISGSSRLLIASRALNIRERTVPMGHSIVTAMSS